jgi:4-amino-4-deoxy-L-arabinose transferase-like glycosyltransferase
VKLGPLLPQRIGWRDHVLGATIAAAYVVWLLATARSLGFPRDEGVYFSAATSYIGWWRMLLERAHDALMPAAIDSAWGINAEHPALMKSLFGLSWWLFHENWHLFSDASTAYRLPGMATAGMSLWTVYLFGARAWTRRAGLVAAALLALMPRVFFHAHLACFDVPIMAMWLLCVYVYWRALERGGVAWTLATGIVYGLALETKHNAWYFPAVIAPHVLWVAWAHRRSLPRGLRLGRVPVPWGLLSMATLGPIVFYALWPRLWTSPRAHFEWYLNFHLHHDYYTIEFLGQNYFGPPSPKAYLPVMVLATVPTTTLVLFLSGATESAVRALARLRAWGVALLRWPSRSPQRAATRPAAERDSGARGVETELLLALSFLVAIGPFFLSTTPIFGGTKHWLPAYPSLALFAGRGLDLVVSAMRRTLPGLGASKWLATQAALVTSVVAAPLAETVHSHPFGLSAYVPLVGGTAGAADLGLNRQFWGFTTQTAASEYLNANAPVGANVFIDDTTWEAWGRMQAEKRVRPDLRAVGVPSESYLALVQHELHMNAVDYGIWVAVASHTPVYVVTHDGVPIVSIYKRTR